MTISGVAGILVNDVNDVLVTALFKYGATCTYKKSLSRAAEWKLPSP